MRSLNPEATAVQLNGSESSRYGQRHQLQDSKGGRETNLDCALSLTTRDGVARKLVFKYQHI